MNRKSLSLFARRYSSIVWQWITRRPQPTSFVVAIGAGVLAWLADHSLFSVVGSASIAFALSHMIGQKGVIFLSFCFASSWLPEVLLNKTKPHFHPIGIMAWIEGIKMFPLLLIFALGFAWLIGGFIGGAILVGEATERLLDQKGQTQLSPNDKVIKHFYLTGLSVIFTTIFIGITVFVLSLFGQI